MKKIYFLLLFAVLSFSMNAQTPLTVAVDFTVTDTEGNQYNLFSILDDGYYVCIDFFYTTCGPCQQTAPKVSEAYEYFGCNTGDVIFLGIDTGDSDAEVIQFDETFGVTYPAVSGIDGGGTAVCGTYGITAYPTVILIAPDHNIVEQDIWPIATAQVLIDVLESHNLGEHPCGTVVETEILSYSIPQQTGAAVFNQNTINVEVANGTDLSNLIPTFTLSDGANAFIGLTQQVSGETVVDFSTGQVIYTIIGNDNTTEENWTVIVSEQILLSEEAQISSFTIENQVGSTTFAGETISVIMPAETDLSSLVPEFTISEGATAYINNIAQESGVSVVDFSNENVVYKVIAENAVNFIEWTVNVTLEQQGPSFGLTTTDGTPITDGQEISVTGNTNTAIDAVVVLLNNSTSEKEVLVSKEVIEAPANAVTHFCWGGSCFGPDVLISLRSEIVAPGASCSSFVGTYEADMYENSAKVRFTFFDIDDETDAVSVIINFNAEFHSALSASETQTFAISNFPNPANNQTKFDVSIPTNLSENATISIFNSNGVLVDKIVINKQNGEKQSIVYNTEKLGAGVYFYTFEANELKKSNKLIIVKK